MVQGRSGNAGKCRAHPQSESGALGPDGRFGGLRGPHHENWAGMVCPPWGAKQTCPIFGTFSGRKCTFYPHVCSECRLGHRAPCLTPRPTEAYPGRKFLIKSQKSVPGTNPGRYLGPSRPGGLNCSRFSSPRGSCHGPGIGFRSGPGDRSLLPSRRILGFRSMAGAIGPNVTSFLGRRHSLAPLQ